MQFKEVGKLFEGEEWKTMINGGGLKSNNFKTATSISDMQNITAEMFNKQFKINSNGISEFSKAQIEAKANAIGLTDSLKNEVLAMASDANMTDKLKTGKLTWAKAIANSGDELETVRDALKNSGKISEEWIESLNNAKPDRLKQTMMDCVNSVDGLADSFVNLESKTSSKTGFFTSAANLGKGLLASLKAIAPYAAAITAVVVAVGALDHALTGYSRAQENLSTSSAKYEETKSELQSLNSQLDETKSRIEELQEIHDTTGLTFAQESELEKLQETNNELQRQVDLKKSLAEIEAKQVAEDAKKASSTEQTRYDYNKEKHGFWKGLWYDLVDNYTYNKIDKKGNLVPTSNNLEWQSQNNGDTTISGQMKGNIDALKQYKEELKEVEKKLIDAPKDSSLLNQQKNLQEQISETTSELGDQAETIQQWIASAKDEDGNVLDGMQSSVRDWSKILTEYQNIGKTAKEIDLNNINDFLANNKSAKAYFDSIIKKGGSATDVLEAFKKTGLSLDDIGVTETGFIKYFNDLVNAAKKASEAVNDVNNNLTMSDVETAFSSKNAGDDYVSLGGYLDKAYDLFQKGLIGTDDFKSVAELISYNIDSSAESFEKNYQKLQRYYTKDDNGEYTAQGVSNFLNDLQSLGKGYAKWNEETGKWELNMSNTAQAAKDMDMSAQSFEAMLGRIQDYDNVGDFKFESSVKQFNEAKDALSKLQEVYGSLGKDDSGKNALKAKLDKWTPQIEAAENDLASLPKEVITQIIFEYDKSQLKQTADEAYNNAKNSGFKDVQSNATAITANDNYKETLNGSVDFSSISREKIPLYFDTDDAIANLKSQLMSGDLTEEQTLKVQAEIINLQNIQNQVMEAFENAHPEITPETDTATATATFEQWAASEEGKKVIVDITGNNKDALSKINELVDEKYETKVNVEADTSEAEEKIAELSSKEIADKVVRVVGEDNASTVVNVWNGLNADDKFTSLSAEDQATTVCTLWNIANANPKFTELSAEDQASFIVELWNDLEPQEKEAIIDADPSALQQATTEANAKLDSVNRNNPNPTISASDRASGTISYILGLLNSITDKTTTVTTHYVETHTSSSGTKHGGKGGGFLSGTAHATGTFNNMSWIKPSWKTKQNETALVGEVGTEIVADPYGHWYTVGDNGAEFSHIPAGSVVFNSRQSSELLKKGFTNSRAVGNPQLRGLPSSLFGGTAYLGSSSGGFRFGGGATNYNNNNYSSPTNYSSTPATQSNNNTSQNNSNSSSNSSAEKTTENLVDFIKILYDRVSRLADLAEKAIDRAVGLVNKQAQATDAIDKVRTELSTAQKAADEFFTLAKNVELADDYKRKIREGNLSIENITDENTKNAISKYQSYWESYQEYSDKTLDLQDKLTDLAEKRLSIIEDEYDALTEINDAIKDVADSKMELNNALGVAIDNSVNFDAIKESIKVQEDTYAQLTKKLNAYQAEISSQLSSGLLKESSESYRNAMKNVQDFTANIYKASKELVELQDKLTQIRIDSIQYIIDGFSRRSDKVDKYTAVLEAGDKTVPENIYQERLDNNNAIIKKNQEARAIWLERQATEDVGSENYQKYAEEIQKLDESTLDLIKDNESLKDSIYSLRIKNLEDAIQKYADLEDELSAFRDLLNDDAFLDKQGGITDEGLAQITLLSQSLGTAKQKIADSTTGLQKLKELYENNVISLDEYNEKSKEYREGIQASTKDVKSYQESLTDLYMKAMQTEVDYLGKIVKKRQEALDKKKSYYEYDKKIKSQNKDINSLKAQIAALEGVNKLLRL